ncbi:MAG: hypothetical protein M1825_002273 [Sarcosagium campestre]|nr:MAG: hypothetical protein M1825_002273 [Sarcosagium campestre]
MPYNTRRKSLSLPSLGIHLPQSSRASVANRSPPSSATTDSHSPPSKRAKRSHASPTPASPVPTPKSSPKPTKSHRTKTAPAQALEHTPPPSPSQYPDTIVDTDGINDDIVVGVINQLQDTANKPQLVKELAAALCNTLSSVESSANPQAIISSRLNAYLKRPWTALSPCPIAKTLIPTHPRRIYFYLTTTPHQPLPIASTESPLPSSRRSIISPSISSDEDQELRKRVALSPSPEVDLSPPEIEEPDHDPLTPAGSFSGRSSLARDISQLDVGLMSHRAISPPLEGDEKEFTQTATQLQSKRSLSIDHAVVAAPPHRAQGASLAGDDGVPHRYHNSLNTNEAHIRDADADRAATPESEEHAALRNSEAAAALFNPGDPTAVMAPHPSVTFSSPLVRPMTSSLHINTTSPLSLNRKIGGAGTVSSASDVVMLDIDAKATAAMDVSSPSFGPLGTGSWSELRSPENIELDELDDMLGEF